MAQLKMYRIKGSPFEDCPPPEGYSISNYSCEEDMTAWGICCLNGLLKDENHVLNFEKRITKRAPFLNPEKDLFFIDFAGEHVGTITAYRNEQGIGDVHMVSIRTDFRGRGLSKAMMAVALRHLDALGCPYSYLTTDEWRKPAIKSYLTAGFLPVEYDVGMQERWEGVLYDLGVTQSLMLNDDTSPYKTIFAKKREE